MILTPLKLTGKAIFGLQRILMLKKVFKSLFPALSLAEDDA